MTQVPMPGSAAEANTQAMRAMSAGDFATAQAMLQQATRQYPQNISLWLNLAACCRALSDVAGAVAAIDGALRIDPRSFMALLMKGSLLERARQATRAAVTYGHAIGLAPPDAALDPSTLAALTHARTVRARYLDDLSAHIHGRVNLREQELRPEAVARMNAFIDSALGRRRNYRQEPTEFFFPGLPAIEFHDRQDFAWLEQFESRTAEIRAELAEIVRQDFQEFTPYVEYTDTVPLDQWAELNHSSRWGAFHLYHYGERVEKNCSRCPATMQALDALPQPKVAGRSPAAMFSALQPGTHIPPHTGVANTRLVVHLPLIVPEGCGFRVGSETREWREGEAWVFDDTIEHEAWNRGTQPRVILICDIWNPRIPEPERAAIAQVMSAIDQFNGGAGEASL